MLLCPACAAELEAGWLRCRHCGADARRAQELSDEEWSPGSEPLDLLDEPSFIGWAGGIEQLVAIDEKLANWVLNGCPEPRPPVVAKHLRRAQPLIDQVVRGDRELTEQVRLDASRRVISHRDGPRRAPERNVLTSLEKLRAMVRPHETPQERDLAYCEGRAWLFNFPPAHREELARREPELVARAARLLLASRYRKTIEKQLRREQR